MERFCTNQEVCNALEINPNTLQNWKKKGLVLPPAGTKRDLLEIARWVANKQSIKPAKRDQAQLIVNKFTRKMEENKEEKKPVPEIKPTKKQKEKPKEASAFDTALEENLENLSIATKQAFEQYSRAIKPVDDSDFEISPAVALKQWSDVSELLRKTEMDCFKMLEKKKQLVRLDSVRQMTSAIFSGLAKAILIVPQKVSPDVDGAEWHVIQDVFRKELINVIEQFRQELTDYQLD